MQCPYCAETIQGGAVVCPHCRHSLALAAPVLDRLAALEARLQEAPREPAAASEPPATGLPWSWLLATAVLCLGWTLSTLWASFPPEWIRLDTPFVVTGVVPPLVFGLAVGRGWRGRSRLAKYLLGLPFGLANLAIVLAVLGAVKGIRVNWVWVLLVFNVGQPWIYASAVWTAEWLEPGRWPAAPPAQGLPGDSRSWPERLKLLIPFLSQVASILATSRYLIQAFGVGS
jgi:hypothetical protein